LKKSENPGSEAGPGSLTVFHAMTDTIASLTVAAVILAAMCGPDLARSFGDWLDRQAARRPR